MPAPNKTHDVTRVHDVSEQDRRFDRLKGYVVVLESSQHDDPTTRDWADEGDPCSDGCSNLGTGGGLNIDAAMPG